MEEKYKSKSLSLLCARNKDANKHADEDKCVQGWIQTCSRKNTNVFKGAHKHVDEHKCDQGKAWMFSRTRKNVFKEEQKCTVRQCISRPSYRQGGSSRLRLFHHKSWYPQISETINHDHQEGSAYRQNNCQIDVILSFSSFIPDTTTSTNEPLDYCLTIKRRQLMNFEADSSKTAVSKLKDRQWSTWMKSRTIPFFDITMMSSQSTPKRSKILFKL